FRSINIKHPPLDKCANVPTKILYQRIVKKARGTLKNKDKIYIIYSVKWQTRGETRNFGRNRSIPNR
ncbi:MAG: hypothetical protein LUE91_03640, partial [Oscillospiraceae bacterium]|nr:hypothetical protein [Oscillospiraceae bacterium]